ncbi:MAG: glycosyltransferase family 4 protein [Clostridia bacterium]|nr:glycosyltransferase family 4 protein [Clostridia bacterium]
MERKETVLLVHNYYKISGGEDTVVENEKKLLEAHGHKVVLYTRRNAEIDSFSPLQKLLFPFRAIYSFRTAREIKKIIEKEGIDVVHVHNTLSLISPSVYRAAKKKKIPVFQTVHNFRLLCPAATFYRDGSICEDCLKGGLGCAVKHKCYRSSFASTLVSAITLKFNRMIGSYKIDYICLTEFTRKKLASLVEESHLFVKPNFTYDRGKKEGKGSYYLFVGRLEEIKGVRLLIEAFSSLSLPLKIAGTGALEGEISEQITGKDNIELLGYQDKEQVTALMKGAKALIMCSQWYETFGMVIIEAFSAGLPVIVGDIGNISSLVEEGVNGTKFVYNDAQSLREAVLRMENASMEEGAYQTYLKRYTPEENYQRLLEIYRHQA